MERKLPTKRSIWALSSQRIGAALSLLITACHLVFPGQQTLPSSDYYITTRRVQDIAKCYNRRTQWIGGQDQGIKNYPQRWQERDSYE
ncbi:MAG: hypothetical protein EZS28_039012 [Streblomastix strix]|uniref:Uncharacterized protein n=1 Tax=Streblomastix strix TaxID=222440 RepID=A0A5J4U6A3_9EUKA|nr:MAG: hypothetical protein EZS28_039012 [Streblomastix strix]